jgi:site-specific DNA-methyltransferase (adenine-specific)
VEEPLKPWIGKIHNGDCLELMRRMPASSIDLVVTSPPYNIRNSTGGGMRGHGGSVWSNAALTDGYDESSDDMPYPEYVAWQRACLEEMMRLIHEAGAIFYNHKWRVQDGLLQDRREIVEGFPVRQIIIWQRAGGINFNRGYFLPTYEVVYLICKPKFLLAASTEPDTPKQSCVIGDVWYIPQDSDNEHPAPFSLKLAMRCIESTDAQVVLDPFMGSGTTALAAEVLGCDWIGIELSKKYCEYAEATLDRHKAG